jgi:hypothetical protein
MRALALRALPRMYRADDGLFVFRLRRDPNGGEIAEGLSRRYTAIVLIGLSTEEPSAAPAVLAGERGADAAQRLVSQVETWDNLGDVALTLWAARAWGVDAAGALRRLLALRPLDDPHPTVELAWALAALCIHGILENAEDLTRPLGQRVLSAYEPRSGLFAHKPTGAPRPGLRAHVGCFADQVYPIQALAHYFAAARDATALDAARLCARAICDAQGAAGQWWWHYDVRTGHVIEGYPVYSVHQDAMAPMALFALQSAAEGTQHAARDTQHSVERGVQWLLHPPETQEPLIDTAADLIWRKVGRYEPGKLSRGLQALASRVHPALRVPAIERAFPPGRIDYECRPYHLGWLLHAWTPDRVPPESSRSESDS